MPQRAHDVWSIRRLLKWTSDHFAARQVDSPRVSAEMLLAHVLGLPSRLDLFLDMDRPASALERSRFRDLVERASRHEPVDYLIGRAPFFLLPHGLKVSPATLIPRPSTETLVEHIVQHSKRTPGWHTPLVADLGTGSGAIAIALAVNLPQCRVVAVDISPAALALARENAQAHAVADRIEFRAGDMLDAVKDLRVTYLASNPPYISDAEWADVPPNVKDHEPALALRGGPDGLGFIRTLIERGREFLADEGQLVLEIAASQKQAVLDLAEASGQWASSRVLADHEGHPRVLVAEAKARRI